MFVESSVRADLPDQQQAADGDKHRPERVVAQGGFPPDPRRQVAAEREHAARRGVDPVQEPASGDGEAREQRRQGHGKRLLPRQFPHEFAEIQAQQEIADESAEIVEDAVVVPAGLSPERILRRLGDAARSVGHCKLSARGPVAHEGDQGGQQPENQEESQFLPPHFLRPGREQRHQQVQPGDHVHEPEVSGRVVEVQEQVLEVLHRFPPVQGVEDGPDGEGDQDADGTPFQEGAGVVVQWELQVGGGDDEQGDAGPRQRQKNGRPDGFRPRLHLRPFTAEVEGFDAVDHQDEETSNHAHPVNPDFALLLQGCNIH